MKRSLPQIAILAALLVLPSLADETGDPFSDAAATPAADVADDPFADAASPSPGKDASDPFADAEADSKPACFAIPSADELSGSSEIRIYREQYVPTIYPREWNGWPVLDLMTLVGLLGLGMAMVWRQTQARWFWIPALLTLLYFGFIRGGCICPVGSVANMTVGLAHPERVGQSTAAMFLLPLLAALLMGRVFCSSGCPLGALQHLLAGRRYLPVPARLRPLLHILPVLVLGATTWLAFRGTCMLVCLLDPYKTAFFFGYGWLHRGIHFFQGDTMEQGFFRVGDATAWGLLAFSLLLGFRVYRPFCRFVCPYGVLLGILSMFAFKRRHIEQSHCIQCGVCEKTCPVDAIRRDKVSGEFSISTFRCIQCNRCSSRCRKSGIA